MRDIVFVTVDSLRADHVGTYGYERDTTPFLDSLAADGHVCERAYAHAPATKVSFPAILSGSSPLMYGGPGNLSPDRAMLAEVLDNAGYRTGGFHSNLFLSAQFGYDRGFDTFYDSREDPSLLSRLRTGIRDRLNQDGLLYRLLKWAFDHTEQHAGVELGSLYTAADDLTDRVRRFLDGAGDEPTFCWVHYMDVHHPYVPPARHQRPFREEPIGDRRAIQLRRKMLKEPAAVTDEELAALVDLYDAELHFTDAQIRRLVRRARDRLDDPVVVVTADHGEEFREHGAFSHGTVHEEGVHVPLVVHDGAGSGRYEEVVGLLDVPPTLCGYADRPAPESYHGHDLRALFRGGGFEREAVVGEYGDFPEEHYVFYVDRRWKYIRDEDGIRLYDLDADPGERTDVLAEYPDERERIEAHLAAHEEEIRATQHETAEVEMDDEVTERLEQLGYKME